MRNNILFFKDISKEHFPLVGGKGLNLGILTSVGIPVPNGFCVSTEAYRDFLAQNDLHSFLRGNTDGAAIRDRLQQAALPDDLEAAILEALSHFAPGSYFAVRSSATAEDLPFASFAGQQDTYLNITGLPQILDAIKRCWASLYTDRAIAYRQKQNIDPEAVYMSVVVQKMVLSDVSGVMFTADPLSQNRRVLSIEAGFGLGEALVSGMISHDSYRYDRRTGAIAEKQITDKKHAIYPLPGGGTETVELDGETASSQVLPVEMIRTLAKLGERIEAHSCSPQAIEWCVEKGELFIVQSREITSLFPLVTPPPGDGKLHAYTSFGHVQMMLAPISPAGIDILGLFFRRADVPFARYESAMLRQAAGRIYIDLSGILQRKHFRKFFIKLFTNVDDPAAQAMLSLTGREDFDRQIAGIPGMLSSIFGLVHTIPPKIAKQLLFGAQEGGVETFNGFMWNTIRSFKAAIDAEDSLTGRLLAIYNHLNLFPTIIKTLAPYMLPGLIAMKQLESMELELLGTNQYAFACVKGLEGNVTTEMGLLVGDLADRVRQSPTLRREFENRDFDSFFTRIKKLSDEADFQNLLRNFMERYGVRAAGEIDIATARWQENPAPLINSVLSMLNGMTEGQHRAEFQTAKEEAHVAAEAFVAAVASKHGRRTARKVSKLIALGRACLPLREHPKFMMMHLFYAAKSALLDEADKLVKAGRLEERTDIFLLTLRELSEAAESGADIRTLVAARKADYERYQTITPPRFLTNEGEIIRAPLNRGDLPAGSIPGTGVSSGVAEGIARVIFDPTDAALEKGEILVAPYTDPGWTTLFINAAGLVTETGGLLTHGAVVAREYGIPAVVSCENATSLIQTGQRLRVDGSNGLVTILEG